MSKYNVGDKVVVRPDLKCGMIGLGDSVMPSMERLAGRMVTINSVRYNDTSYTVKEDDYNYTDAMFVQKVETLGFSKKNLKVGYIVILRSGAEFFVVNAGNDGNLFFGHPSGTYARLSEFKDNLTCNCSNRNDVMKVYGFASDLSQTVTLAKGSRKLLWERELPITELTMEQVAKLAGVDVANLKIKK